MQKKTILALPLLIAASSPAFAHVGHGATSGFSAGLAHPMMGADHLLAMVAVGLLAALAGGRALFAWPAAFLGAMVAGAVMAMSGLALPFVEPAILASLVVLGALIGLSTRMPAGIGAALIALFGLFHGHAHGTEMAGGALGYLAGFTIATATLHVVGIGLGLATRGAKRETRLARAAGWAVCATGIALLAA